MTISRDQKWDFPRIFSGIFHRKLIDDINFYWNSAIKLNEIQTKEQKGKKLIPKMAPKWRGKEINILSWLFSRNLLKFQLKFMCIDKSKCNLPNWNENLYEITILLRKLSVKIFLSRWKNLLGLSLTKFRKIMRVLGFWSAVIVLVLGKNLDNFSGGRN